jgi:signal transduction histidine kinase
MNDGIGVAPASLRLHHWPVKHSRVGTADRPWIATTLAAAFVVIAAIVLGIYAKAPEFPGAAGMGPMAPRMPAPPQNLPTLLHLLGVGSVVWYAVALSLIPLLLIARQVNTERHGRARIAILALAIFAALFMITAAIEFYDAYHVVQTRPPFIAYLPVALRQDLLAWIALAAIVIAVETRRRAVQSRIERERLRAQVAEQRLVALTGQLHPHFLFNTLQGISTLIHRDANAADEMLSKLSDLLRDLLRHRENALVSLGDEIRYIRTYLEISQLRFADRLKFTIDAPAELNDAAVPLFILQPLVENALSHGIGGQARGGTISVRVWRDADRLRLEVKDDGAGLPAGASIGEGLGLSNTRERLRASFDSNGRLALTAVAEGGAIALVDVPYRVLASTRA